MKTISSGMTKFNKIVFPSMWFGFLIIFFIVSLYSKIVKNQELPIIFIIQPVIMMIFGYFLFKKLIFDLADEVVDYGDYLLVKNGKIEDKIYITNIKNISFTTFSNPRRVTISLREQSTLGSEVSFIPISDFSFNPFKKCQVVEDLINRVDALRN